MTSQKQHFPSFATTISALGILLYCIGFLRVELELNNQKKRLNALENNPETKTPSGDPNIVKIIKDARGMYIVFFLSHAAFIHSLKLNKYWNVSYHPEKNILQDFTMINFVNLPCILITICLRLSGLNQWAKCAWTFVFFCLFVCWLRFKRLKYIFKRRTGAPGGERREKRRDDCSGLWASCVSCWQIN